METNNTNRTEIKPMSRCDERISWERDVVPHNLASSEDSTFAVIVKQLGGGTWAESVAREILNEGSMDGKEGY